MRLVLGKGITQKEEAKNAPTWGKNAIMGAGDIAQLGSACLPGRRT